MGGSCKAYLAFTLAEVLIVLGIIGLVADMTIPTLTSSYRKQVVETRLLKFYTAINQAVTFSEIDNGPSGDWTFPTTSYNADEMKEWFDKYFSKYMRTLSVEAKDFGVVVSFPDGSLLLIFNHNGAARQLHAYFYWQSKDYKRAGKKMGREYFTFFFRPSLSREFGPYFPWLKFTREEYMNNSSAGCASGSTTPHYCTRLIQFDGWKIKEDYPFKF